MTDTPADGDSEQQLWQDRDLSGKSFAGEDLSGVRFVNCDLRGTSFRGADLTEASFDGCVAFDPDGDQCADFSYANLREASFRNCDLTAGEFANIRGYDLRLENCQLGGVSFAGADFRLPIGNHSELTAFTMTGCNFAYGDLSSTFLKGCVLTDNRMIEAVLHETTLDEAVLSGSDLSNVSGRGLSLRGADLRGAVFNSLDPRRVDLDGVRISLEQTLCLLEPLGVIVEPDA